MLHRLLMQVNWLKLKYKLFAVLHPGAWIRNNRTDLEWDQELWDLLVRGEIEYVGSHYAVIGKHMVWIENHPYASGTMGSPNGMNTMSCGRATALFLRSQLPAARIIQKLRGLEPVKPLWAYTSKNGQHII